MKKRGMDVRWAFDTAKQVDGREAAGLVAMFVLVPCSNFTFVTCFKLGKVTKPRKKDDPSPSRRPPKFHLLMYQTILLIFTLFSFFVGFFFFFFFLFIILFIIILVGFFITIFLFSSLFFFATLIFPAVILIQPLI